jgi:hypothetical protein
MRIFQMQGSKSLSPLGRLFGCLALAVGVWGLTLRTTQESKAAEAVNDLAFVPPNAGAFITVKVDDLWQAPALKEVRTLVEKEIPNASKEIEGFLGLKHDEIDRITLFLPTLPTPSGREPGTAITIQVVAKKAYDPVKLLNAVEAYTLEEMEAVHQRERMQWEKKMMPKVPEFKGKFDDPPLPPKLSPVKLPPVAPPPPPPPPLPKKQFEPLVDLPNGGFEQIEKGLGEIRLPDLNAPFYASRKNRYALYLLSEKSYVIIPADGGEEVGLYGLVGLLLKKSSTGNLSSALSVGSKHHLFGAVDVKQANRLYGKQLPEGFPGRNLLGATSASLSVDVTNEITLNLALEAPDADTAKEIERTANGLLSIAREFAPQVKKGILRDESMKDFVPLLEQLETAVNNATCKLNGKTVSVTVSAKTENLLGPALSAMVLQVRRNAERMTYLNNFKQVGLAVHNFHDAMRSFPFPGYDAKGQIAKSFDETKLSWRVAILPYIEQENLYRQFRLNEPWDSENNKKLIPQMPKIYAARPEAKLRAGETFIQIFSGPKGMKPRSSIVGILDGTSNTIMVAEAGEAVIWTKPDDMKFDPDKELPKLGGNFNGDFIVAMCDGSVRFVERKKVTDKVLKLAIMPDDGIPFEW